MDKWKSIIKYWQNLSITTKFSVVFVMLLISIALVSITNYISLMYVQKEAKTTILTSTKIQGLILEMDRDLQEARLLQRDFFLRYSTMGFNQAHETYVEQAQEKITYVVNLSKQLQTHIATSNVNKAIEEQNINLNLYLSAAQRYKTTFSEAVELVTILAAPKTGLESQLAENSKKLKATLQTGEHNLIDYYQQIQIYEKDYLISRQRPTMQSALNTIFELQQAIKNSALLNKKEKTDLLQQLDNHQIIIQKILNIDATIKSKLNDFDLQTKAVNPVSTKLIALANQEIEFAQARIANITQLAILILAIIGLISILFVILLAKMFNATITQNIVKLTDVINQWQAGNLELYAHIDSQDELGHLANGFNNMATRINILVNNLEQQVTKRTHHLENVALLGEQLNAILDLEQLLVTLVNQIKNTFNYYHVHIYLLDETNKNLVVAEGTGWAGVEMKTQKHTIALSNANHIISQAALSSEVIIINNVQNSPHWYPNPLIPDTKTEMAVPVIVEKKVVGVLDVQQDKINGLDETDANILRSLASYVAVALTNANLFKQNKAALTETEQLYHISQQMIIADDLSQVIATMIEGIAISSINKAVLFTFKYTANNQFESLIIEANWYSGHGTPPTPVGTHYKIKEHTQDLNLLFSFEPIFFNNVQNNQQLHLSIVNRMKELNIDTMAILPLWGQNFQKGVLVLEGETPYNFTHREKRLCRSLAGQLAVTVENQRLFQQMKQRALELAWAKEVAETANKVKSSFLSSMSHELRTPLNGVLGYTQILAEDKNLTPKQADGLNIIKHSGEHLLALINDILDISKIEAGDLNLKLTDIHLETFLKEIVDNIQKKAHQKNISFIYQPSSTLPTGVEVDGKRLKQVLLNLLNNAIKFTNKGHVIFKISSKNLNQKTCKLYFEVTDSGIGISPKNLEKIFLPFEQTTETYVQSEGTGLGLTISQKLIHAMDSTLHVKSKVNEGSTFWFEVELPVISIKKKTTQYLDHPIVGYKGPRLKVLIVDDKQYNRLVLTNMLQPLGFKIIIAENGQQAVEKAQLTHPDLIFMDMIMPIMTGFEATQKIRKLPELKKVVLFGSSSSIPKENYEINLTGCDAFLAKPVNMQTLFSLIETHLHIKWIHKETIIETNHATLNHLQHLENTFAVPSIEDLKIGYALAKRGSISKIKKWATQLEQKDKEYKIFVNKVQKLASFFESEAILALIKKHMPKEE